MNHMLHLLIKISFRISMVLSAYDISRMRDLKVPLAADLENNNYVEKKRLRAGIMPAYNMGNSKLRPLWANTVMLYQFCFWQILKMLMF